MLKITLDNYTAELVDTKLSVVLTSPFLLMASGLDGGNLEFMFNNAVVAEMTIDGNMIFMKS